MAPNRVIIEETQETDSEDDSNSLLDSFDGKDLSRLFDDFVVKNKKGRDYKHTPQTLAECKTPISYGERTSRSRVRNSEPFKVSPVKQKSLRNMADSNGLQRLGSLKSEKIKSNLDDIDSDFSDTCKEDISGKGSKVNSNFKRAKKVDEFANTDPLQP